MIKGLEALEKLLENYDKTEDVIWFVGKSNLETIEKELKALDFIRTREWLVEIILGYCAGYDSVNETATYDLLKEVLNNGR